MVRVREAVTKTWLKVDKNLSDDHQEMYQNCGRRFDTESAIYIRVLKRY